MVASFPTKRSEAYNKKRLAGMTKTGNRKLGNCVKNNKTKQLSQKTGIQKISVGFHIFTMRLITGVINIIILKIIEKIIEMAIKKTGSEDDVWFKLMNWF